MLNSVSRLTYLEIIKSLSFDENNMTISKFLMMFRRAIE